MFFGERTFVIQILWSNLYHTNCTNQTVEKKEVQTDWIFLFVLIAFYKFLKFLKVLNKNDHNLNVSID